MILLTKAWKVARDSLDCTLTLFLLCCRNDRVLKSFDLSLAEELLRKLRPWLSSSLEGESRSGVLPAEPNVPRIFILSALLREGLGRGRVCKEYVRCMDSLGTSSARDEVSPLFSSSSSLETVEGVAAEGGSVSDTSSMASMRGTLPTIKYSSRSISDDGVAPNERV